MASPIDQFKIFSYFSVSGIPFTNSAMAMMIGSALQLVFLWLLPRQFTFFRSIGELYYEFISEIVMSCSGKKAGFLIPFASAIFSTIFFGNIIGLIPNVFTFTSHLLPNFILASIILVSVVLIGIWRNGVSFFKIFWPSGIPSVINVLICTIEIFAFLMKPVSLCLRLSINMIVGHILLKVLLQLASGLGVAGIGVAPMYVMMLCFEMGVAFLQAYIFTIMACISLEDAVESHH